MNTDNKKKKDIIEIFVKNKMGIKLSNDEKKLYDNLDNDEKKIIDELIKNPSFYNDIEIIINKILSNDNLSYYDSKLNKEYKDEETILNNIIK